MRRRFASQWWLLHSRAQMLYRRSSRCENCACPREEMNGQWGDVTKRSDKQVGYLRDISKDIRYHENQSASVKIGRLLD